MKDPLFAWLTKKAIRYLALVASVASMTFAVEGQPGCPGCSRTAQLEITTNSEEWGERSVGTMVAEAFLSNCFHIVSPYAIRDPLLPDQPPASPRAPEYILEASFRENLTGETTSTMEVKLFFNGTSRELVQSWKTEHTSEIVSFPWHRQKWVKNRDAIGPQIRPVEETLLKDFEKRPESCDIEPEREEICHGEEMSITLNGINDFKGRQSREFNRIVVQAVEGKILNGTPVSVDPELKAFKVGDGNIRVTYQAPEDPGIEEDTVNVYNSCEILEQNLIPLTQTIPRDKISSKKIKLTHCLIKSSLLRLRTDERNKKERHNLFPNLKEDYVEIWDRNQQVTIHLKFARKPTFTFPESDNLVRMIFSLVSWSVSDSSFRIKEDGHRLEVSDLLGKTAERKWDGNSNGTLQEVSLVGERDGLDLEILYNSRERRIVDVLSFPHFDLFVQWHGHRDCWSWERNREKKDCSISLDDEGFAHLPMLIEEAQRSRNGKTLILLGKKFEQGEISRDEYEMEIRITSY